MKMRVIARMAARFAVPDSHLRFDSQNWAENDAQIDRYLNTLPSTEVLQMIDDLFNGEPPAKVPE